MGLTKMQKLTAEHHSLLVLEDEYVAITIAELIEDGYKHGLKDIARARFINDCHDTYEKLHQVTLALNLEVIRQNERRDNYYKTMAEAAQMNIDRDKMYIEDMKRWKQLDKGKEDK